MHPKNQIISLLSTLLSQKLQKKSVTTRHAQYIWYFFCPYTFSGLWLLFNMKTPTKKPNFFHSPSPLLFPIQKSPAFTCIWIVFFSKVRFNFVEKRDKKKRTRKWNSKSWSFKVVQWLSFSQSDNDNDFKKKMKILFFFFSLIAYYYQIHPSIQKNNNFSPLPHFSTKSSSRFTHTTQDTNFLLHVQRNLLWVSSWETNLRRSSRYFIIIFFQVFLFQ